MYFNPCLLLISNGYFISICIDLAATIDQVLILTKIPSKDAYDLGDELFLRCDRSTMRPLLWAINGTLYPSSSLPPKHTYIGSGLVLSNIDVNVHGTVYECCTSETERSNKVVVKIERDREGYNTRNAGQPVQFLPLLSLMTLSFFVSDI